MSHYYKMIYMAPWNFGGAYGIDNPIDLYPGRIFTAQGNRFTWNMHYYNTFFRPGGGILANMPMIHFCDNALDTMLWHYLIIGPKVSASGYPYEIKPLTKVYRERSRDNTKLFQSGANKIEIVRPISMGEIERAAIAEFDANPQSAIFKYPNINVLKIVMQMKERNK